MNPSPLSEFLRRKDIGCAQQARWLGMKKPSSSLESESASERLRRIREQLRQQAESPDHFNRR